MTGRQAQTKPTPASMAVQVSGSAVVQLVSVLSARALDLMSIFALAQAKRTKPAAQALFRGSDPLTEPRPRYSQCTNQKDSNEADLWIERHLHFHNTNIGSVSSAKLATVLKALVEVSDALVPTLHTPDTGVGDE